MIQAQQSTKTIPIPASLSLYAPTLRAASGAERARPARSSADATHKFQSDVSLARGAPRARPRAPLAAECTLLSGQRPPGLGAKHCRSVASGLRARCGHGTCPGGGASEAPARPAHYARGDASERAAKPSRARAHTEARYVSRVAARTHTHTRARAGRRRRAPGTARTRSAASGRRGPRALGPGSAGGTSPQAGGGRRRRTLPGHDERR